MLTPARTLLAAAYVALLVGTGWMLDQLAHREFTAHLRDQAAHALALAARGETPYRWRFVSPDDVIAGRIFGAASFDFSGDELVVRSSAAAFEIGLPLARAVDIRRFPHLHIALDADAQAKLQIVVRQTLAAPELASNSIALPRGSNSLSLDLSQLTWSDGALGVDAPVSAAMLRLRVNLPAGNTVRLRAAVLERIDGAQRIDLAQTPVIIDPGDNPVAGIAVYRLPLRAETQKMDIDIIEKNINVYKALLILLPQRGRVEQQIALRNAVFAAFPGAILIPESALDASFEQARAEAAAVAPKAGIDLVRWASLVAYAVMLGYFRWRPPLEPRRRALSENLLVLAGPLWLVLGEHFDGNPDAAQEILIGLAVVYAISLSIGKRWRWNGTVRAWLLAGAVVAFAALVGIALHRPTDALRAIGPGHIARYLVWALFQQYLICAVCTERWRIVTGGAASAVYLSALAFALMHTPNAALMLATLLGGVCWCALYLRERALLPLAASHAASALLLLALLPSEILLSAEVSARFFQ